MPSLLFEIWRNPDDGSQEMSQVCRSSDELRRKTAPNAVRVHSFRAETDFEAFEMHNDWNGWGPWRPVSDWSELRYTDEDLLDQDDYLRERDV